MKGYLIIESGHLAIVTDCYENWEDLKSKNHFVTLAPNIDDFDATELMINDPRDEWLRRQGNPFSNEELQNNWIGYKVFLSDNQWRNPYRTIFHNGTGWKSSNRANVFLKIFEN